MLNTAGRFGGLLCPVPFGYVVAETASDQIPFWGVAATVMIPGFLFCRIDVTRRLLKQPIPAAV